MSMEIHVFSDRRLASIAEWQQAIDAEGFGLRLSTDGSLEGLRGFLPAQWGGRQAGFECFHDRAAELQDCYSADVDFGRVWSEALSFAWGANVASCLGAYMAATAYARATDGIVFDPQDSRIFTPPEAAEAAREIERDLPKMEEEMRRILAQASQPPS
jgi:hypothetical protein